MNKSSITIKIHLQPRASCEGIDGFMGDAVKVRITAPPIKGKANKALQRFLAKKLKISPSQVEIIAGQHTRQKLVRITGVSKEAVHEALCVDLSSV